MIFDAHIVGQYLSVVNDYNPLHKDIVPGQLIVEKAFLSCNVAWDDYKVKYVQTTDINESIDCHMPEDNEIIVSNKDGGVKLVIIKN